MVNKKNLAIILTVIIIIIAVAALLKWGETNDPGLARGADVAAEFVETWQRDPQSGLSQKIESVKDLVTADFVVSLESKLEVDAPSGVDPVTCLSVGATNFSLLVSETGPEDLSASSGQAEMSVEVRERVSGADDELASTISMVNSSGGWKVREIVCASSDDISDIPTE